MTVVSQVANVLLDTGWTLFASRNQVPVGSSIYENEISADANPLTSLDPITATTPWRTSSGRGDSITASPTWAVRTWKGMDKTIQKIKDDLKMRIESQGLSLTRREVRVNQFMEIHGESPSCADNFAASDLNSLNPVGQ